MASTPDNATRLSAALETMTPALLIEIILKQQQAMEELRLEIAWLKGQQRRDSKPSSKPLSMDLLKKSEHQADAPTAEAKQRQPGGNQAMRENRAKASAG